MNVFVVVEGEVGEVRVYKSWIPLVNNEITYVSDVFAIRKNNFSIISGYGYPNYFDVIENAIEDVNGLENIDRLVVAVDSEELSFEEKYCEISDLLRMKRCNSPTFIIIQHFCLEAWALGNRRVGPRNPRHPILREYKSIWARSHFSGQQVKREGCRS